MTAVSGKSDNGCDSNAHPAVDGRGNLVGGRFEVGELLSTGGDGECRDPRCRRDGPTGRCMGSHCAACGKPSSYQGHFTTVAWWEPNDRPGSIGDAVKFPDGKGYFSCQPEYDAAVAALREEAKGHA